MIPVKIPTELLVDMGDIEYGYWDYKNKKKITIHDPEYKIETYQEENGCVTKPDVTWKNKLGTCWECSLFEYASLSQLSIIDEIYTFYIEGNNKGKPDIFHSGVIFHYKFKTKQWSSPRWHWFENWFPLYGVNGPWYTRAEVEEFICKVTDKFFPNKGIFFNSGYDVESLLHQKGTITVPQYLEVARGKKYKFPY